jgi:hypothetical protein
MHVDDDITEVDQHPFGFALAFHAQRLDVEVLGELHYFIGDRLHVARRSTRCDHHEIGDAALATHVDLDHVPCFEFFDRRVDCLQQYVRPAGGDWEGGS